MKINKIVVALMALLLCLPVCAMAEETIIEAIEITVPEPKAGEQFNPDAVIAAFTTTSAEKRNIDEVAFVMSSYMFSSDTDSSVYTDWKLLQPGDVYEADKHYTLLVEFYYEEFGARPDDFLTNNIGDVIAAKTINGQANNDDAVRMYLGYWEYEQSYDRAVLAYQ